MWVNVVLETITFPALQLSPSHELWINGPEERVREVKLQSEQLTLPEWQREIRLDPTDAEKEEEVVIIIVLRVMVPEEEM